MREVRRYALGLKAGGKDPASDRDRQRGAITIAEPGSRFLTEYVPQHCEANTADTNTDGQLSFSLIPLWPPPHQRCPTR